MHEESPDKKGPLMSFDKGLKRLIPNANVRAIVLLSTLFALALFIQIWRISSDSNKTATESKETVIADESYWDSNDYKNRIKAQTPQSFTSELKAWLSGDSQEFSRRKFEDMMYINTNVPSLYGEDIETLIPQNFNYLETVGRARYQYAKEKGFLNEDPALIKLGTIICDSGEKTERITGIELYDWRYASMPKLAEFMKTKPDWKIQQGEMILDISERWIQDRALLRSKTPENQPVGLFSYLIFRDPASNRIFLADHTILDKNGVDAELTIARLSTKWNKQPKLYFKSGYEACRRINDIPSIPYGQSH